MKHAFIDLIVLSFEYEKLISVIGSVRAMRVFILWRSSDQGHGRPLPIEVATSRFCFSFHFDIGTSVSVAVLALTHGHG